VLYIIQSPGRVEQSIDGRKRLDTEVNVKRQGCQREAGRGVGAGRIHINTTTVKRALRTLGLQWMHRECVLACVN
jgi:hypothetical protein